MWPPSTGEVRIGPDSAAEARRARLLGLVSQRPAVLPWKRAIDDVRFTQRIARRAGFRAEQVLEEFGLAGHETKRARQLSGGMLQPVNIASAIAHDPAVLLMDEPFSALDEMKREEIGSWFDRELAQRPKTVLFVTHNIDKAVMLADRLIVFSPAPGRVLEAVAVPAPRPRLPADPSLRRGRVACQGPAAPRLGPRLARHVREAGHHGSRRPRGA